MTGPIPHGTIKNIMETVAGGNASLLEMKKICKQFPGVIALKDVDFSLQKGDVHVLMGANGAGKSTLMKILSGVYRKDSGEIYRV